MTTLNVRSHIGTDGTLELKLPAGVKEADVDVIIAFQPVSHTGWKSEAERLEWRKIC
ncbi:MAG TPA: hypothetical protein VG326_17445 [Tepidisphaeraceae bacterium]|jgi:hypothetical protein|nr:hypothetical protein [Tepidisphaeraceae bacterium]